MEADNCPTYQVCYIHTCPVYNVQYSDKLVQPFHDNRIALDQLVRGPVKPPVHPPRMTCVIYQNNRLFMLIKKIKVPHPKKLALNWFWPKNHFVSYSAQKDKNLNI